MTLSSLIFCNRNDKELLGLALVRLVVLLASVEFLKCPVVLSYKQVKTGIEEWHSGMAE